MVWLVDRWGGVTPVTFGTLLDMPPAFYAYALDCEWCFFPDQAREKAKAAREAAKLRPV